MENCDVALYDSLVKIIPIILPVWSAETAIIAGHGAALVLRSYLTIRMARLDGSVVRAVLERNPSTFMKQLGIWLLAAVPSTFLGSAIKAMESSLQHMFRRRLTLHAYDAYMRNNTFYRVNSIDCGQTYVDHELTQVSHNSSTLVLRRFTSQRIVFCLTGCG
jgi:ABC-type uncharacterized transport system fused permease/ATPase subunit